MTPRRVLHAHSTFAPGGKELRSVFLINAFGAAARHSILSAMPDQMGARDAIAQGIDADFPQDAPPLTGRPSLARYRALAAYMRGFDLVLTYNWGAMDLVAARRFFPKDCPPLIHHEDGFNADESDRRLWRRTLFRRAVLPAATKLVVPSRTLAGIARREWRAPDAQLVHIRNGVDHARFAQPPLINAIPGFTKHPDDVVIGTIAGLRAVKNIPLLVAAVASLDRNTRLIVVGEGPERGAITAAAQHYGIADRLILPGHLPDPARYLGLFDVFALSSHSEQAPMALMEAMAAARAVVATDVGDVRQMVAPENADYLVAVRDVAGFAACLADLVANPAQRDALGAANQRIAQRDFDAKAMVRDYGRVYELPVPSGWVAS